MVVLHVGVGAFAQGQLVDSCRVGRIADIEQRDLGPLDTSVLRCVLTHSQKEPLADGVEVRGVAEDLQLAHDLGRGRVGEVERIERVGLAERDHIGHVAHEPDRVDLLGLAKPVDPPNGFHLTG